MKDWMKWMALTIALAVVIHLIVVNGLPYFVMLRLWSRSKGVLNTVYHSSPTTSESRSVVRPSPDLLYSACGYDVSESPLRIRATIPETYWSISFYDTNTNNFFVKNDRQVKSKEVEFILVRRDMPPRYTGDGEVVYSPTDRGIILFRMLITDENKVKELIKLQKQASCTPLE
jgi:uncharacterized membrane protein